MTFSPSQLLSSIEGRKLVDSINDTSFKKLIRLSLIGGVVGTTLLLKIPTNALVKTVPWLIMFATVVIAWGSL